MLDPFGITGLPPAAFNPLDRIDPAGLDVADNCMTLADGLANRRKDIAPILNYELDRFAEWEGKRGPFNKEACERYLAFAMSSQAGWPGNLRDRAASVTRMATFSPKGRIDSDCVDAEVMRPKRLPLRNDRLEMPSCDASQLNGWPKLGSEKGGLKVHNGVTYAVIGRASPRLVSASTQRITTLGSV